MIIMLITSLKKLKSYPRTRRNSKGWRKDPRKLICWTLTRVKTLWQRRMKARGDCWLGSSGPTSRSTFWRTTWRGSTPSRSTPTSSTSPCSPSTAPTRWASRWTPFWKTKRRCTSKLATTCAWSRRTSGRSSERWSPKGATTQNGSKWTLSLTCTTCSTKLTRTSWKYEKYYFPWETI